MDEVLILASDQLDDDEFLVMDMIADEENSEVTNYNRLDLTSLTEDEIEKTFDSSGTIFAVFAWHFRFHRNLKPIPE